MTTIHPSARIAAGADIAHDVDIGPNCTIGGEVVIAQGCRLSDNVNVAGRTSVGRDTVIGAFASLGTPPQSTAPFDPAGRLTVGAGCRFESRITVNVGSSSGGGVTQIGDRCWMMANSHVGHDCQLGSDVVLGVGSALAGHCLIGDFAAFDNFSAAHQFSQVGGSVRVDIRTFVRSDIIPFGVASGDISYLNGLNHAGMRARDFDENDIGIADTMYRDLFFGPDVFSARVERAAIRYAGHALAGQIVDFIRATRHRSLCHPLPPAADGSADGAVMSVAE